MEDEDFVFDDEAYGEDPIVEAAAFEEVVAAFSETTAPVDGE